jgi:hypothetical protein
MISPLLLLHYSENGEDEEEEAKPDMKALIGSGEDLPQEFWQVTASRSPPSTFTPRTRRRRRTYLK